MTLEVVGGVCIGHCGIFSARMRGTGELCSLGQPGRLLPR